jgi:hypothetical protein
VSSGAGPARRARRARCAACQGPNRSPSLAIANRTNAHNNHMGGETIDTTRRDWSPIYRRPQKAPTKAAPVRASAAPGTHDRVDSIAYRVLLFVIVVVVVVMYWFFFFFFFVFVLFFFFFFCFFFFTVCSTCRFAFVVVAISGRQSSASEARFVRFSLVLSHVLVIRSASFETTHAAPKRVVEPEPDFDETNG